MFVRTPRLTLRPGWPEDAPELAQAIGHEGVVRNLARAPWPYALADAEAFLADFGGPETPRFVICAHAAGSVRIIGMVGVEPLASAAHELGYWITPDAQGRGYATEAARGALAAAHALGIRRVEAGHFVDNPASGRVLRKLGFVPTGELRMTQSRGRGGEVETVRFTRELADQPACDDDPARTRMAA